MLPFADGPVAVATERTWEHPTALLGDLHEGRFRILETLPLAAGRQVRIPFAPDRATLVALVCEDGERGRWQAALDLLAERPEQFPGY